MVSCQHILGQYYQPGYYDESDPAAPRAGQASQATQAGQPSELADDFRNLSVDEQQYGYDEYAYSGAHGAPAYDPAQASLGYGHGYPPAHPQTQQPAPSSSNKKGKGVESGSKSQKKNSQSSKSTSSKKPHGRSKAPKGLAGDHDPFFTKGQNQAPTQAAAAHNQGGAADYDEEDFQEQGGPSQFAADGSGFAPQPTASPEPVDTDYPGKESQCHINRLSR
jgi:hypothetical protein